MKFITSLIALFFVLLLTTFYLLLTTNTHAAGCTISASPTEIPPHGSFSVTLGSLTAGTTYIIYYDNSSFSSQTTGDSSGTFTVTVSVDQIFGAGDSRSSSGSFQVTATNGHASGHPDLEICSPQEGITITVDPSLYPTPPYETPPYGAPPYGTPPYETPPYGTPPYGYPTPPYATPYDTPPPYGTPYLTPEYPSPETAFTQAQRQGGIINCPETGTTFSIWACFHPAHLFAHEPQPGDTEAPGFGRLASDILLILTSVAASLSIIFVVLAGIKFVTSGGDPKNLASARSTLTYAIIGLIVTILAFVILRVVQAILRVNVPGV